MDTTDVVLIETLMSVVGNVGFPLVLAIYLLIRFEKKIESLTEAIHNLKEVINIKKVK